ncbi:MAG: 16S rRNA (uracil(1498)-N(3))-methyltransferase [Bacilli bacterium]|nr:16S rRNA (uracil(1498)-N(3))-methyltransferase [Bacilli bacterium]
MQRYFVSKIDNYEDIILSEDDSYHIIKVMRMSLKDKIEVVCSGVLHICEITSLDKVVKCRVIESVLENVRKIPKVTIAQALVKEQKMDYILQKSTELGVFEIIPISCERSVVKPDGKETKKIERWRKVLKEASEQSKRTDIPKIERICKLDELKSLDFTHKFICSVNEKSKSIKSVLSKVDIDDKILFVIGPEGGLSEKEEKLLMESGFEAISFGDNVLRTETSSLFILSVVNYEFLR